MEVELDEFEAIVLFGAVKDSYEREFESLCQIHTPGILRSHVRSHVQALHDSAWKLALSLRAQGYTMKEADDLKPPDFDKLFALDKRPDGGKA